MHSRTSPAVPWHEAWPLEGLERVPRCPVCGATSRALLYTDLVDESFRVAPGRWTAWSCERCRSAYLDPRPTVASIHRAYESYYTHSEVPFTAAERGIARFRRALSNGYKNWRFGTRLAPATKLGVLATLLMPRTRTRFDREYRHMPLLPGGGRVLDVGFGNGGFLQCATNMGWDCVGIDTDAAVVANAKKKGFVVSVASLDDSAEPDESFDVITAAHVLEHVHDPRAFVRRCLQLLKPGGLLWIETPNIDSHGHASFAAHWRGLESPRHLTLFNPRSLRSLLMDAGFVKVDDLPQPSPVRSMYTMSDCLRRGQPLPAQEGVPLALRVRIAGAEVIERLFPSRREFLTVVARKQLKPGSSTASLGR